MHPNDLAPLTERDIAEYLMQNPGFFQRNPDLLTDLHLGSAHGQRVVSLHERQAEMLREKIKVLEQRLIDMIRHGSENSVTTNRLLHWYLRAVYGAASRHSRMGCRCSLRRVRLCPRRKQRYQKLRFLAHHALLRHARWRRSRALAR